MPVDVVGLPSKAEGRTPGIDGKFRSEDLGSDSDSGAAVSTNWGGVALNDDEDFRLDSPEIATLRLLNDIVGNVDQSKTPRGQSCT